MLRLTKSYIKFLKFNLVNLFFFYYFITKGIFSSTQQAIMMFIHFINANFIVVFKTII